jgi:hypothetical protein
MHETHIRMKNGELFSGMMRMFRPEEGWFSVLDHFGEERMVMFSEVYSAVTPGSRIAFGMVTERDELRRAAEDLAQGRRHGWAGYPEDVEDWEIEALSR